MEEQELNLILESLASIQCARSIAEALGGVAQAVSVISDARSAAVYLDDPKQDVAALVALHGDRSAFSAHSILPADEIRSLEPDRVFDADSLPGALSAIARSISTDCMWFRLSTQSRAVGTVIVTGFDSIPSAHTGRLLLQTAAFAGRQVDSLKIFDHLQSRVAVLSDLYEVGKRITSTLDVSAVLDQIITTVAKLVDATRCSIMLLDSDRETLKIRASVGIPEEIVKTACRKIGEGIAGGVLKTGEPLFIRNIREAAGVETTQAANYRSASLICVPLSARGVTIGVVNVNDRRDGGDFSEEDFNLVMLFASQAAIAIDNANLRTELWTKSVTDGLTQTFVHSYFMTELERMVGEAAAKNGHLAVIMTDLDHFKRINDTWGHQAGDEILVSLASILRNVVRSGDLVARYGGEEFVVVLEGVPPSGVLRVAERLRKTVEQTDFPVIDHNTVTTSVGIGMFPFDGTDAVTLIGAADRNLYVSKEGGRNRVSATPETMAAAQSE